MIHEARFKGGVAVKRIVHVLLELTHRCCNHWALRFREAAQRSVDRTLQQRAEEAVAVRARGADESREVGQYNVDRRVRGNCCSGSRVILRSMSA